MYGLKFSIVAGTFASEVGKYTLVNYPDGFTASNTMIMAVQINVGNAVWVTNTHGGTIQSSVTLLGNGLAPIPLQSGNVGRNFKLLLAHT